MNVLKSAKREYEVFKAKLNDTFDEEASKNVKTKLYRHLEKIQVEQMGSTQKKFIRDVTLACDDANHVDAHNRDSSDGTFVCHDGNPSEAHTSNFIDVTLASDDRQLNALNVVEKKKKRKFTRRWLHPQPKKERQRKRKKNDDNYVQIVSEVEEKLFLRGNNFCPVKPTIW